LALERRADTFYSSVLLRNVDVSVPVGYGKLYVRCAHALSAQSDLYTRPLARRSSVSRCVPCRKATQHVFLSALDGDISSTQCMYGQRLRPPLPHGKVRSRPARCAIAGQCGDSGRAVRACRKFGITWPGPWAECTPHKLFGSSCGNAISSYLYPPDHHRASSREQAQCFHHSYQSQTRSL